MWFLITIAIIIGIGVLISLVLAIPIDALFNVDVHGKPQLKVRIKWLFGLVSFDANAQKGKLKETKKPAKPQEKPVKPKKKTGRADSWQQFTIVTEIIRIKGLLNEVKKLIIRLFRCFDFKQFNGDFSVGLFDPADTAFLFGIIAAVTIPLGHPLTGNFRLNPSYDGLAFEGNLSGIIRLRPIYLVAPVVLFIFSPAILKAIWILTTKRRKRRSPQKARYQLAA